MSDATGFARCDNYVLANPVERTARVERAWETDAPGHVEKCPAFVFAVNDVRLCTSHPVQVTVERMGDRYLASCQKLHVFAEGESHAAAMDDLAGQVVYFYNRYSKLSKDEVTGLAAELRDIYQKRFGLKGAR
jgi:hypothetical protein